MTNTSNPQLTVDVRVFERGTLKAFADVTFPSALGELTLRGFRVLQKEGEAPWVAFPSASYTKDGKVINSQLMQVSGSLKKHLCDAVLAGYEISKERR
jgi:DNA-binding cell septation regulator SpoVG